MLTIKPAWSLYLNSLVFDIEPEKQFISIPVFNDTSRTNLYSVSAYRIDKPGNGNENRIQVDEMEVIWSPLSLTNTPGGVDSFKVFYRGPKDNNERYYRIVFKESAMMLIPFRKNEKATEIVPIVTMSAILVVRPGETHIRYSLDADKGSLKNTGNTFFRVIIQQGCNGDDESSTQFHMLPGETYQSESVRAENKIFIVALGKYFAVENGCTKASTTK
ncbi:fimbrial protein [Mixta theicola]|uniref:Fimbrial protein n=2 Tax=Mixta theicola TaxID=1458355 RepID=A0A2K1QCM2_9GAMM|nr:fimbrial protein [Mixta theicola]